MAESGTAHAIRVLLVDDDPIDLTMLGAELAKQGFQVGKALGGEEALARMAAEPYDICISDWSMPGMEGVELFRRAKALARGAPAYFLLLTANPDKSLHLEAIKAGVDDVAEKSWEPATLQARMLIATRVLDLKRRAG